MSDIIITRFDYNEVLLLLNRFDNNFKPKLSDEVNLEHYSKKLSENALFAIKKDGDTIIGEVAFYCNELLSQIYITSVCVDPLFEGKGIAYQLISFLKDKYSLNYGKMALEVRKDNNKAKFLYDKLGFVVVEDRLEKLYMELEF